ncbi:NAD-dependent epimerase/dehydratase family protein [Dyella sp.]|jgi:UDP-glucose 4-epimerase|uniref:NAD-dependent epimerase/dehydratase family protein n=1 Tax=Dyella sp. TaxID=1869338 RepID=UPI002D7909C4|nr:NAD-dependent epimerase/dehydratase family protein [Dyella sp.]HET6433214.1 NAD-dependent epimerase/dehydratase family protein [Dyella sp.]
MTVGSVMVLGAGGFIGRRLVQALAAAGRPVIAVSRHAANFDHDGVEQVVGELRAAEDFRPLLARSQTVVHVASNSTPASSAGLPLAEITGNLYPTLALLQAMQSFPDRGLLYLSSGGCLYASSAPTGVSEKAPPDPRSYHGAGKVAAESFISAWTSQFRTSATILRPSNVYGPGQAARTGFGIVPTAFARMLKDETLTVWGDGSSVRDYLFIDDLVALCLKMIATPMPSGARMFHAGSGEGVSLRNLLAVMEHASGKRLRRIYEASRAVDANCVVLDSSEVRNAYDWKPAVTLEAGLRRTWEWFTTTQR